MSKIFVLRLNSLLSSADSTLRFGEDNQIVIPMPVIDELQNYRGKPEKVEIARQILKYVESFNINNLLSFGEEQSNKSILRIVKTPKEPEGLILMELLMMIYAYFKSANSCKKKAGIK